MYNIKVRDVFLFTEAQKAPMSQYYLTNLLPYPVHNVLLETNISATTLKVIWSIGKGSEIFWVNSHLFDFHLKANYVCIVTWKYSPEMCLVFVEFEVETWT